MPTRLEDMERLSSDGQALEEDLRRLFVQARESVTQQRTPQPPKPQPIVTPPASVQEAFDAAPPPHRGFQEPAPPQAPRLEAEYLTPEQARERLLEYVRHLRKFSRAMLNVAKLANAIADLIEFGTVRRGPNDRPQRR